jgi:monomeric sarcosine oxidase
MASSQKKEYEVAVIGAGVFGAWIAYQLRQARKDVLLIDALGPGNSRSSSGGESRIMRMGYGPDEIYSRSAQRSMQLWREFSTSLNEQLFHQTGVLWLAHEDDPYPVATAETLAKLAIPFEQLTTSELARRYPQVDLEGIVFGLLEPNSGVLMARRAVQAVVREAVHNGVEYLHAAALPSEGEGRLDSIRTIDGKRLGAEDFVFACGPWLPKLFPELLAGRIQPTRQEVFFFGVPPGDTRFALPCLPTLIDFKDEAYVLPDLEGRGVKIAIDRHGPLFDPDSNDRVVTAEGLAEVRRYIGRRMPALKDAAVTETRVCQYENTSNGDFLIDRHTDFENVWLVGGGSGHGFKHGPAVGEYVANRITGVTKEAEPRFSFAGKGTEQTRAVY